MAKTKEPGSIYWSLVDPEWVSLNESWDDGPDEFANQFRAAPTKVGHLYAAHWCQSEVCNGGLRQFFSNTTGLLAPEALEGFRAIGLTEWADVLTEAMKFFGNPYPRSRADRQKLLPNRRGRKRGNLDLFFDLDERFFAWLRAKPDRWELAADKYAKGGRRRARRCT